VLAVVLDLAVGDLADSAQLGRRVDLHVSILPEGLVLSDQ
jgi:hypothetical protein